MWLIEMLSGMTLAFYLLNVKFRHTVNICAIGFFKVGFKTFSALENHFGERLELPKFKEENLAPIYKSKIQEPIRERVTAKKTPEGGMYLEVTDETIAKWLSKNKDLKVEER